MKTEKEVSHKGIIKDVNQKGIKVSIVVLSGCVGCQVKGSCNMSDQKEKELDIECNPTLYHIGQEVEIELKETQGFYALFLGYILPFIILLSIMIILSKLTPNEAIIGFVSIGSLVPYFLILFLFRNKIKKKFTYKVNSLN